MGFPSVLGCLQKMRAACFPEQIKDWVVTAGHVGRDGTHCSLLWFHCTESEGCWIRVPSARLRITESVPWLQSLRLLSLYVPGLPPFPTVPSCSPLAESLPR